MGLARARLGAALFRLRVSRVVSLIREHFGIALLQAVAGRPVVTSQPDRPGSVLLAHDRARQVVRRPVDQANF